MQHNDEVRKKKEIANEIAPEEDRQGLIHLVGLEIKEEQNSKKAVEQDSIHKYIKNYQETEDMVASRGAKQILGGIAAKLDF
jgi:hypothetical protein